MRKNPLIILLGFVFLWESNVIGTELFVRHKTITVNDREAQVLSIQQSDGTYGIRRKKGQNFDVKLKNELQVPTSIHWHGLLLPNDQDGVAFITQFPIYPGLSYQYQFPLMQSGTFWMHSHFGLQEQRLLSAPLIIYDDDEVLLADQEAVLLLTDFSFTSPDEILKKLRCPDKPMNMHNKHNMPDLVEVNYDAFLINYRDNRHPEIIKAQPGNKIRLRFINAANATNFFILLGELEGEAIAVDGNRIHSLRASQFELAVAQRIDIIVTLPEQGGIFPIVTQGEGTDMQTGFFLSTKESKDPLIIPEKALTKAGALTLKQERQLKALSSLPKKQVNNRVDIELGGDMQNYVWTLNRQSWPEVTPIIIEKGQRVEFVFRNTTHMSHPMHLHGHVFQVTAIDGQAIEGAIRDTILVTPGSSVAIQFDAEHPGVWPLHCHLLYHLESGMLTVVRYKDFEQPL